MVDLGGLDTISRMLELISYLFSVSVYVREKLSATKEASRTTELRARFAYRPTNDVFIMIRQC